MNQPLARILVDGFDITVPLVLGKTLCRMFSKVALGAPPAIRTELGPCWRYQGYCQPEKDGSNGYSIVSHKGRPKRGHRLVAQAFHGLAPDAPDNEVLHLCNVKCCVRPSHLTTGTHQENMAQAGVDRVLKRAILAPDLVLELRSRHENDESVSDLAREKGILKETVWMAVRARTYSYLGSGSTRPKKKSPQIANGRHWRATLECKDIIPIYVSYWRDGESQELLAKRYGVTRCAISGIVHNRTWLHIVRPKFDAA